MARRCRVMPGKAVALEGATLPSSLNAVAKRVVPRADARARNPDRGDWATGFFVRVLKHMPK
jgi:hypothetical protein